MLSYHQHWHGKQFSLWQSESRQFVTWSLLDRQNSIGLWYEQYLYSLPVVTQFWFQFPDRTVSFSCCNWNLIVLIIVFRTLALISQLGTHGSQIKSSKTTTMLDQHQKFKTLNKKNRPTFLNGQKISSIVESQKEKTNIQWNYSRNKYHATK